MKKIISLLVLSFCFFAAFAANEYKKVKVDREGVLEEVIGNRIHDIDSIWVEGPIDSTDIRTLWNASFHGKLVYGRFY